MSKGRPDWEILVGDKATLEHLASIQDDAYDAPHPLQEVVEKLLETLLTDDEREIFYMRFGEQLPHREIARRLGYKSHMIIQVKVDRIMEKVKHGLSTTTSDL